MNHSRDVSRVEAHCGREGGSKTSAVFALVTRKRFFRRRHHNFALHPTVELLTSAQCEKAHWRVVSESPFLKQKKSAIQTKQYSVQSYLQLKIVWCRRTCRVRFYIYVSNLRNLPFVRPGFGDVPSTTSASPLQVASA